MTIKQLLGDPNASASALHNRVKLVFYILLILQIPLGIVLSLITPNDILAHPVARHFTALMSSFVPFVRETGRLTTILANEFIAAVLYANALMCCSAFVLALLRDKNYVPDKVVPRTIRLKEKQPITYYAAILLFSGCCTFFNVVPYGNSPTIKQKSMLESTIVMGSYGAGLIMALCLGAVFGFFLIYAHIRSLQTHVDD